MTNQEKKARLRRYLAAEREMKRLEAEIARWRSRAERVTAALGVAPRAGVRAGQIEQAVAVLDGLYRKLGQDWDGLIAMRAEIEAAIASVSDDRLRSLLRLRYIDGLAWDQVAEKLEIDERWVYRLHEKALFNLTIESHV